MPLSKRQIDWAEGPDGEHFKARRYELLAHDPTCLSLPHAWLPRVKGVSCDVGACDNCPVLFHTDEGAVSYGYYPDPPITDENGYEMSLCECCSRKYR